MSVVKDIVDAVESLDGGDAEASLCPLSRALETTARQEYPTMTGDEACRRFVHDNLERIARWSFGGMLTSRMRFRYVHPDVIQDASGMCSLEELIVHVIRCGRHDEGLPRNLYFTRDQALRLHAQAVVLPQSLLAGLIAAVAASPVNADTIAPQGAGVDLNGNFTPLEELWGRRDARPS